MDEVAERVQAALWSGGRACIAGMAHSILDRNQPGEDLRKARIGAPALEYISAVQQSLLTLAGACSGHNAHVPDSSTD